MFNLVFASLSYNNSVDIYLFKVKNRKTETMCEVCSKLTNFIANSKEILQIALLFPLLTLNIYMLAGNLNLPI